MSEKRGGGDVVHDWRRTLAMRENGAKAFEFDTPCCLLCSLSVR